LALLLSGFEAAANLLDLRCGANSCAIIVRAVCAALRVDLLLLLEGEFAACTAEVFLLLRLVVVLLLLLSPTPMENEGDSAACIEPISR